MALSEAQKACAAVNKAFTAAILSESVPELRKAIPGVKVRKDAWVYRNWEDSWEFHTIPRSGVIEPLYWSGTAYNAAEAREKGWWAYVGKFHPEAAE